MVQADEVKWFSTHIKAVQTGLSRAQESLIRHSGYFTEMNERIRQLEKHIHYPAQNKQAELKSSAAQAQATASAPMRTDVEAILTMTAFCKRLLDTHDLAYAVTLEVRNEARRALGLKEREV